MLNYNTKVACIDNKVNKSIVANAVCRDILADNGLEHFSKELENWLKAKIMESSLADMLVNEQRMYVIDLAKKVCCDICFITSANATSNCSISIDPVLTSFVNNVFDDNEIDIQDVIDECYDEIENCPFDTYKDTIIIDDKMFVYTEESGEVVNKNKLEGTLKEFVEDVCEKIGVTLAEHVAANVETLVGDILGNPNGFVCPPNKYTLQLHINPHPNYTTENLKKRIISRLHYQRNKGDICIKDFSIVQNESGDFDVRMAIYDVIDNVDTMYDNIAFRLSKTSGKPWYRCEIERMRKI